jgi:tRNA pseudouridine55 synthase
METFGEFDGALLVDKPAGPTSHDVVDVIRAHLGLKKVGHCGTLDPAATGLLILLLGKATRLSEKLMSDDKVYEGCVHFGIATSSYDAQGSVTAAAPPPPLALEQINDTAAALTGDLMQEPPMVSAVKQGGVPLYKLARKGIEVERKARLVHIYNFRFTDYVAPLGWCRVACTKGTYVRSLAHELGQKLGCGAHLRHLRRTDSGKFSVADAIELEQLIQTAPSSLAARIIPFLTLAR